MNQITVAGGCYQENCTSLSINDTFGSGGRAAFALAAAGIETQWHYYCPQEMQSDIKLLLAHERLAHSPYKSESLVSFEYFHPLSKPVYRPFPVKTNPTIELSADTILRFGFMEGQAKINAKRAVYDPQSPDAPEAFTTNGSQAEELTVVLNERELRNYCKAEEESTAIEKLFALEAPHGVIVKAGAQGARVYQNGQLTGQIPAYQSDRVYKIGTGDVFSAAVAYNWALENKDLMTAANMASKCVAQYCNTRIPRVMLEDAQSRLVPIKRNSNGQVYLAGPFFTMPELWLIEECFNKLRELGVEVFSPYHHVGLGPPEKVVQPDLNGLRNSQVVLALLDGCDPGTVFEIGYAVRHGISVIALSQNPKLGDQTMMLGSQECSLTDDFATAIYRAAWEAGK